MSDPKYPDEYDKAVRYSADHAGVGNILAGLTDTDRLGGHYADQTRRGVVADYLSDLGRHDEADLLRDPHQHVVLRDGQVRKGRLNLRDVLEAHRSSLYALELLHLRDDPRGLNPFSSNSPTIYPSRYLNPRASGPLVPIMSGPTPIWDYDSLIDTNSEEPAVSVFGPNGHEMIPVRTLREHLADGLAKFLEARGVQRKSPLWRHVNRIRMAPLDQPAE